jgi:hypothetical protein
VSAPKPIDLDALEAGVRVNMLTLVHEVRLRPWGRGWHCLCDCGGSTVVSSSHLRLRPPNSCGCSPRKMNRKRRYDAALEDVRNIWRGMLRRCHSDADAGFVNYGGRGITVCDRWRESFEAFVADVGPRPSKAYSIDRINNDGNYEPGNVRWATCEQQQKNRRNARFVTVESVTRHISEWAADAGLPPDLIDERLAAGWPAALAVTAPIGSINRWQRHWRARAPKATCKRGHEYSADNTRVETGPRGAYRVCLTCRRETSKRSWRRRKSGAAGLTTTTRDRASGEE